MAGGVTRPMERKRSFYRHRVMRRSWCEKLSSRVHQLHGLGSIVWKDDMLDRVTAIRFDRQRTTGKTGPCDLECARKDDSTVELVAKFSDGCERKTGSLVAEAITAMLAADLDLPVPEPFLVDFDAEFVDGVPNRVVAARMRASVPVAFGSAKLPPGFAVMPTGKAIPTVIRQQAIEVFVFDCLVQNPDRRPSNPNLLFDGKNFAIFDHELTFMTTGIIGWKPPWEIGALQAVHADQHVLFAELKGKSYDLTRLEGAWRAISDARIADYRSALPAEWSDAAAVADEATRFIAQVRDNIERSIAEAVRVLL